MDARDDYPYLDLLSNGEAQRALDELDKLRAQVSSAERKIERLANENQELWGMVGVNEGQSDFLLRREP